MSALVSTEAFFAALFPNLDPEESIEIRPLPDPLPKKRRFCPDAATAARYALNLEDRHGVYFGMCGRYEKIGTKEGVRTVRALWADVDDKKFPDGRAGALAAIATFSLKSSIVIDSGGGLYPIWLLTTAFDVTTEANRAYIENLLKRLYGHLGKLDSVQDVSRVLRVPNTVNRKYDPPRPATIIAFHPSIRHNIGLFDSCLPAEASPAPQPATRTSNTYKDDDTSADDVREMLRYIPAKGAYKEDWLTVLMAVADKFPGPGGVHLCEEWSPGEPGEIARKFASFKRTGSDRVTFGTLVYMAKQHGYLPPRPPVRVALPAKPPDPPVTPGMPEEAPASLPPIATLAHQPAPEPVVATDDEPCQQLAAENARLRQEIATLRQERSRIFAVLRNPGLTQGERLTALAAVFEVHSQQSRGALDEDGFARVPLARLGEQAGCSPQRASAHVDTLAKSGLFEKRVDRQLAEYTDPETGKKSHRWESQMRLRLAAPPNEMLQACAKAAPERERSGGHRAPRCADHPDAGVITRKTVVCAECGQILDRHDTTTALDLHHEGPTTDAVHPQNATAQTNGHAHATEQTALPMLAFHYERPTSPPESCDEIPPRGSTLVLVKDTHAERPTSLPPTAPSHEVARVCCCWPECDSPVRERAGPNGTPVLVCGYNHDQAWIPIGPAVAPPRARPLVAAP